MVFIGSLVYFIRYILKNWFVFAKKRQTSKGIVRKVSISLWKRPNAVQILNLAAFLATSVKLSIYKYYQRESRRTELPRQNYEFNELPNDEEKLHALFLREYINGIVEEMPERC